MSPQPTQEKPTLDALRALREAYHAAAFVAEHLGNGTAGPTVNGPAGRRSLQAVLSDVAVRVRKARVQLCATGYPVPNAWLNPSVFVDVLTGVKRGETRVKLRGWDVEQFKRVAAQIDGAMARFEAGAPTAATSTGAPADGAAASAYDVFVCHASEDKTAVVRPLTDELVKRGLRAWVDYRELLLGDSLRKRIDEGLRRSRFGIVIVSPRFFAKQWPQAELDGLVALEMADRRKRILPIWHEVDYADVAQHSPTLAGRLAAKWADGLSRVADEIVRAVRG